MLGSHTLQDCARAWSQDVNCLKTDQANFAGEVQKYKEIMVVWQSKEDFIYFCYDVG